MPVREGFRFTFSIEILESGNMVAKTIKKLAEEMSPGINILPG